MKSYEIAFVHFCARSVMNHMMRQVNGLDVMLYFWDDRDGPDFCGWWFGPKVAMGLAATDDIPIWMNYSIMMNHFASFWIASRTSLEYSKNCSIQIL